MNFIIVIFVETALERRWLNFMVIMYAVVCDPAELYSNKLGGVSNILSISFKSMNVVFSFHKYPFIHHNPNQRVSFKTR